MDITLRRGRTGARVGAPIKRVNTCDGGKEFQLVRNWTVRIFSFFLFFFKRSGFKEERISTLDVPNNFFKVFLKKKTKNFFKVILIQ